MAEKRIFSSSICVKTSATTLSKLELFPAEQWDDGPAGCYRVRENRRWIDLPEGGRCFLTPKQLSELVVERLTGARPAFVSEKPDLPKGTPVRVPNKKVIDGRPLYDITKTVSDPIRLFDGRWHVAVLLYGKGIVFVPADGLECK